jgi:hypothetical protein
LYEFAAAERRAAFPSKKYYEIPEEGVVVKLALELAREFDLEAVQTMANSIAYLWTVELIAGESRL